MNYEYIEQLIIEESRNTPSVIFNCETGILEINGKSIPDNAYEFYKPVFDWLIKYKIQPKDFTLINLKFSFFNVDTALCLSNILKEIESMYITGNPVKINWIYTDEYMLESGEEFSSFINVPMDFIEQEPSKVEFPFFFN